jgi:preprotein translocase subunit Sec63
MIQESLSPCAILVLLTSKNDGNWRIYVDSHAINKIIMGYKFSIPQLNDMLNQLCGATVFSRIDLRSWYYQIWIRLGDEWKRLSRQKMSCMSG